MFSPLPLPPPRPEAKALPAPQGVRELRLRFSSKLCHPVFTGARLEAEGGATLHVILQDARSGVAAVGLGEELSLLKLDVVVLEGDFNKPDDEDWSEV